MKTVVCVPKCLVCDLAQPDRHVVLLEAPGVLLPTVQQVPSLSKQTRAILVHWCEFISNIIKIYVAAFPCT